MLKWLRNLFKPATPPPPRTQPTVSKGDMVGNVKILTQAQLDKHTPFKVGESYRVGECIVTLRGSKAEVTKVIEYWDKKRAAKEAALRERGIELMLMSPDQLMKLKLQEWHAKRKEKGNIVQRIMKAMGGKRYIPPESIPPSGKPGNRFQDIMIESGIATKELDKDKV